MAHTAIKSEDEKKEYFDTKEELEEKVTKLANLIKKSKHFVVFTGAGISTSTGIPDFRSGYNTVLKTGPGCWETAAVGHETKPREVVPFLSAIPSFTHMAIVKLLQMGYVKFVISQNVDGLHRKSGVPPELLAELHGNVNLEKCGKCKKEVLRDFEVGCSFDHLTGRSCPIPGCGGDLYDSIINFGENLPHRELREGFSHSEKADLCLAMGSSLRVTPAAHMPQEVAKHGDLVIVNLQKTPLDSESSFVIHSLCDNMMSLLMTKMDLKVDPFILHRRVKISLKEDFGQYALLIEGIEIDGTPFSLFSKVEILLRGEKVELKEEPFELFLCPALDTPWFHMKENQTQAEIKIRLHFQGHYNEPEVELTVSLSDLKSKVFEMAFTPTKKDISKWDKIVLL